MTYILFIIGFIALIKGADYLIEGASSLALKFGWSPLFIGLTIVAFGTSAPELAVNVLASLNGNAGIVIGTILGSNVANILLILGVSALVTPLVVKKSTTSKEIPLSLLAVLVLGVLVNDRLFAGEQYDILSKGDGLILLSFFLIFMYYVASLRIDNQPSATVVKHAPFVSVGMVLGGLAGLVVGGHWIVNGATVLAVQLGLSETMIGLTIVAIGTSLPELATSAVAAYKGKADLAIGNIIGSNIFNIFWILAVSAIINPVYFSPVLNVDLVLTGAITVLLSLVLFIGKRNVLQRSEGAGFIALYVVYIAFLIYRG